MPLPSASTQPRQAGGMCCLSFPRGCAQLTIGEVLCGVALLSAVIIVVLGLVDFLTVGVWLIVR